eukprot:5324382-Ditylum_brightwellii.AAC.1
MPMMTRAKAAGRAQDITDVTPQPNFNSGKYKQEEQGGVTGNDPSGRHQEKIIKTNSANTKIRNTLVSRMTSAKTDGQAQDVTDNITHSTANFGENKLEEQSGGIGNVPSKGRQGSDTKNKNIKGIP